MSQPLDAQFAKHSAFRPKLLAIFTLAMLCSGSVTAQTPASKETCEAAGFEYHPVGDQPQCRNELVIPWWTTALDWSSELVITGTSPLKNNTIVSLAFRKQHGSQHGYTDLAPVLLSYSTDPGNVHCTYALNVVLAKHENFHVRLLGAADEQCQPVSEGASGTLQVRVVSQDVEGTTDRIALSYALYPDTTGVPSWQATIGALWVSRLTGKAMTQVIVTPPGERTPSTTGSIRNASVSAFDVMNADACQDGVGTVCPESTMKLSLYDANGALVDSRDEVFKPGEVKAWTVDDAFAKEKILSQCSLLEEPPEGCSLPFLGVVTAEVLSGPGKAAMGSLRVAMPCDEKGCASTGGSGTGVPSWSY